MKTVTAKLANMRKAQEFVVYPASTRKDSIIIQSDHAIGEFNPITGKGILNCKGSGYKYFMHLNEMMGAIPFDFPAEFVAECIAVQPKSGDRIGGNVFVA